MGPDSIPILMLVLLGVIVYIFPAALASHRRCKAAAGIAIINIFLGWTFVGWVVALAWAASGEKKSEVSNLGDLWVVTHGKAPEGLPPSI